ncbi:MAG: D-aminoacyl-tRNA deacylase [Nitrospinae bacterium]|nr:D-aminoacyl-tRNA deacylase [Nitrospinota bacterium]
MRAVVQRVREACVRVDSDVVGEIRGGLLVFLGVGRADNEKDADFLAEKISNLRIFADEAQKMNLSLLDSGGAMLVVSQFTLHGDCRKGRRPAFIAAAPPEQAEPLYERFVAQVEKLGLRVAAGRFGAMMEVSLVNDGPVTLLLDSRGAF